MGFDQDIKNLLLQYEFSSLYFEWYKVTLQTPGNPHLTPCYLGSSEHNTRGRIILGLPLMPADVRVT